jgi:hypothetical protein
MKKAVIILSLIVLIIGAKAQGNLQFNQVKLVSTSEIVPSGKVWKVENAIFAGGTPFTITTYTYGSMSYAVNGLACYISSSGGPPTGNNYANASTFPFWLPAGSSLASGSNMRYLSVIEFNIIP